MRRAKLTEAVLFWFIALTPLWWVCGVLLPMVMVGVPLLFLLHPPRDAATRWLVGLWLLAGALQSLSAGINWALGEEMLAELPRRLFTMYSVGWALMGMMLAIGAGLPRDGTRLVRAMVLQGAAVLVLAAISYSMRNGGLREFGIQTPLAVLKSSFPSAQHHFVAKFFHMEDFEGEETVRLTLFFPWTAGLGVWGLVLIFASLMERSWPWRLLGLAGGLTGLLSSFSRAATVAAALALCLLVALRASNRLRLVALTLGLVVANLAILAGWDPVDQFERFINAFHAARAGSSMVRQIIYDWSWSLWMDSPWIGYGRMGDVFSQWFAAAPIGSHSTFYGTLYTGGVMTLTGILAAYGMTVWLAARQLRSGHYGDQAAFCTVIAIGVVAYGESFYSLVPSLTSPLLWIGWRIASTRTEEAAAPLPNTFSRATS